MHLKLHRNKSDIYKTHTLYANHMQIILQVQLSFQQMISLERFHMFILQKPDAVHS